MPDAKALFATGEPASAIFSRGEMLNSLQEEPKTQVPPHRSFGGRVVDSISDAVPATGALVGGALATPAAVALAVPSFGASSLLIPGAGAAGYGGGEFLKRLLDKVSGRPGTPAPVNVPASAGRGANEAMNAFSAGQYISNLAKGAQMAPSLASEIGAAGNPFANLGDKAFRSVHSEAAKPARPIMAAPRGDLAEKGAKFASPASAEAAQRGAQSLRRLSSPLAQDAEIGARGARGDAMQEALDEFLRTNDARLAGANDTALGAVRKAIGPYPVTTRTLETPPSGVLDAFGKPLPGKPGTRATVMRPPGENVVNAGYNEPNTQNKVMVDPASRDALSRVKSIGLEDSAAGGVRGDAFADKMRADSQGLTPARADQAASDAGEMESLARTIQRQRGGIQQQGPSDILPRSLYESQKLLAGPRSQMMGLRPETPESALQNNTIRLAELEAAKRGLPSLDPAARNAAQNGLPRPAMQSLASPHGAALTGALAGTSAQTATEIIRSLLAKMQQ